MISREPIADITVDETWACEALDWLDRSRTEEAACRPKAA
jgi:hypothetical protein